MRTVWVCMAGCPPLDFPPQPGRKPTNSSKESVDSQSSLCLSVLAMWQSDLVKPEGGRKRRQKAVQDQPERSELSGEGMCEIPGASTGSGSGALAAGVSRLGSCATLAPAQQSQGDGYEYECNR
eukprot:164663-Rhodomonas_salina.2